MIVRSMEKDKEWLESLRHTEETFDNVDVIPSYSSSIAIINH